MFINISCYTKKKIPTTQRSLKKNVKKILKYLYGKKSYKINLDIIFVDNKDIRLLNKKFLNKNENTDVLCFNYDRQNGEIIISIEEIISQAKNYKNSIKEELMFVLVHGILHFKGETDYTKRDKIKMLNHATKIIKRLKLCF
ncbi:MAG: rRNA maturation RNase YbeY [Endomicrobiia bacterium]